MTLYTGHSINMSIQEAFEDAIRQVVRHQVETHEQPVKEIEVRRVYAERTAEGSFRNVFVEIEAR